LPSQFGYAPQHNFPERCDDSKFHHEVDGYAMLPEVDNHKPYDFASVKKLAPVSLIGTLKPNPALPPIPSQESKSG
jgi:hypothetical protein